VDRAGGRPETEREIALDGAPLGIDLPGARARLGGSLSRPAIGALAGAAAGWFGDAAGCALQDAAGKEINSLARAAARSSGR
jgi:hypothetical protein